MKSENFNKLLKPSAEFITLMLLIVFSFFGLATVQTYLKDLPFVQEAEIVIEKIINIFFSFLTDVRPLTGWIILAIILVYGAIKLVRSRREIIDSLTPYVYPENSNKFVSKTSTFVSEIFNLILISALLILAYALLSFTPFIYQLIRYIVGGSYQLNTTITESILIVVAWIVGWYLLSIIMRLRVKT